jgi:phospholipid/cholesterol/gamma-HCH transport system permease protein
VDPLASIGMGDRRPAWTTRLDGADAVVALSHDWTTADSADETGWAGEVLGQTGAAGLRFDASGLGRWDSSLLVFLAALRGLAGQRQIRFDDRGLPEAARRLLALLPALAPAAAPPGVRPPLVERVGRSLLDLGGEGIAVAQLVGDQLILVGAALHRRARMRALDLVGCMYEAGIAALPMVGLVNLLVGGILAFVGAVQLRRFGADIYVANLVGVAEVREMAAVMTAIVVSGRTGGAYAAEISAMKGSEEIDALRVIGLPVQEYLILPRTLALALMMPLLYVYAAALGIFGGWMVAVLTLNLSSETFVAQIISAVSVHEVLFGLAKSFAFGALIAIASCRIGLKAGRSAADVGHAATRAVVVGIVGVIALDALFAVCANALGV